MNTPLSKAGMQLGIAVEVKNLQELIALKKLNPDRRTIRAAASRFLLRKPEPRPTLRTNWAGRHYL